MSKTIQELLSGLPAWEAALADTDVRSVLQLPDTRFTGHEL